MDSLRIAGKTGHNSRALSQRVTTTSNGWPANSSTCFERLTRNVNVHVPQRPHREGVHARRLGPGTMGVHCASAEIA